VLVIGGAPPPVPASDEAVADAVRERLRAGTGDGPRQISTAVAEELGVSRRVVYEAVLRLRAERDERAAP
jgi:DNA-binding GntR family transcriptional regulator